MRKSDMLEDDGIIIILYISSKIMQAQNVLVKTLKVG